MKDTPDVVRIIIHYNVVFQDCVAMMSMVCYRWFSWYEGIPPIDVASVRCFCFCSSIPSSWEIDMMDDDATSLSGGVPRNQSRTSSELVRNQSIIGSIWAAIGLEGSHTVFLADVSNRSLLRKHPVDRTVLYRYHPPALSVGAFILQQTLFLQSRHHLLHG